MLAWSTLVLLFTPLVYNWLRRWGLTPNEAQQVGQQVLIALHRQIKTYDSRQSKETFRTWLVNLTWNEFQEHNSPEMKESVNGFSDAKSAELTETKRWPDQNEDIVAQEMDRLRASALSVAKKTFPQKDWDAFQQLAMENLSVTKVAENLGCPANEVFVARSKVMRKLRQEFDGLIEF